MTLAPRPCVSRLKASYHRSSFHPRRLFPRAFKLSPSVKNNPPSTSASFGLTLVPAPSSCPLISLLPFYAFVPPLQGEKDFSLASHCLGMSPWSPPPGWPPACPSTKDEGWLPLCSHRGCFWPSALLSLSVSEPSATGPAWEAGELLFPCCETWDGSSSARAAPCLFLLPFCSLTPESLCSVGSAAC